MRVQKPGNPLSGVCFRFDLGISHDLAQSEVVGPHSKLLAWDGNPSFPPCSQLVCHSHNYNTWPVLVSITATRV